MSVGKHMVNYDSMVVLTHFKGIRWAGSVGSLKNIAIGCATGIEDNGACRPDDETFRSGDGRAVHETWWSRQKPHQSFR